ncbi:MAG TPA: peptidylprolyl isomerase [Methanocorpusculum sp.]|nr:peptidylprolyl isomerase [Methanocorpusculum sp.]
MAIENGDYIRLNYTGSVNGNTFDTTNAELAKKAGIFRENAMYNPIVVKVGAGHVLPGLDEDLIGKEIGKEYTIIIPAEKAFGEHKKDEVKAVDKRALPQKVSILERVRVDGREGVVINKIGNRYLLDFNHPLAGKEVTYIYKIEEIVEDTLERLSGTIRLFTGRAMNVNNAHRQFVSVEIPPMMAMYNQNWMMTKYMITQEAFDLFPEIESVKFIETFPRKNIKDNESPEEKKKE